MPLEGVAPAHEDAPPFAESNRQPTGTLPPALSRVTTYDGAVGLQLSVIVWFRVTLRFGCGGMQVKETVALPPSDVILTFVAVLVGPP